MAGKFLHLAVNFKDKSPTSDVLEEIEQVLNTAKDWYRYAPNCWLIYTNQTPKIWHERLERIPWLDNQRYLIIGINLSERSGWLPRDTWNWINKERA